MFAAKAVVFCLLVHLVSSQNCLNYVSTNESSCNKIFKLLENQIVDSDANLYSLRKVFYPTSQTEPSLVNVSYDLQVSSVKNLSCPGDPESNTNPRYDRLPPEALQFLKVHAWSSKIFYTLFHPATINRLQPQLLQTILSNIDGLYNPTTATTVETALTWSTTGPILTVELVIDLELSCWPTLFTIESSLNDLTSVLKVYADSQENVSSWGADEKGYALLGNVFIDEWWLYINLAYPSSNALPEVNIILSILLTLMISFGVYYALWNVAPANSDEKNFLFSYSVVWTGVALLSILNFFLLLYEISSLSDWCDYENSCLESAGESKIGWLIWMLIYMIIAFIILLVRFIQGKTKHREIFVPEWRAFVVTTPFVSTFILMIAFFYKFFMKPLLKIRKIRNLWISLMETVRYVFRCPRQAKNIVGKIIRFSAIYVLYMTVFVSASLVTFSIVPVLLQTFLYPFRVIAAYSFFFAAFALYALAAFMATFLWKEKPPTTGRLLLYLSATSLAFVFISIIGVPFITLYQLLVSGSFSDNPLILFGVSLLPSLLLSSPLVWLFRSKLLPRFLEIDEEEEEDDESDSEEEKKKNKKKMKKKEDKKKAKEAAEELSDPKHVAIEMKEV